LRPATVWLLVVTPRIAATGATVTVRLAGGGRSAFKQLGASSWWAGLQEPPSIVQRLGFDDGEFGEGSIVQALELRWGGTAKRSGILAAYYWRDATFTLYSGPEGGLDADYSVVLSGRIADALPEPGRITLQMADPAVDLARPVLAGAVFAGTGGIEGVAELKGRPKRRAMGNCRNVELWSLDPATNIWVATDPARPLQAIDQVYDRGNAASSLTTVAWAGSIAATLTALQAASAPQGGAAIAPSIGCIKWWFANPGKLSCDLRGEIGSGYVDRPADIAAWAVAAVNGPAVNAASLTAARALRNIESGLLVSDDSSAGEIITRLLSGVSLWWGMKSSGEMEFGAWAFGASAGNITASRAVRVKTHKPVKRLTLGWRQNNMVMSRGDIAASLFWSEVTGSGRPADNAGTTLQLYNQNAGTYQFVGNTVEKIANGGAWNYNAYGSDVQVGSAFVSFTLDTINTFGGLTSHANGGGNYGDLDFSVHRSGDGHWRSYNYGGGINLDLGTGFTGSTQWMVTYDGNYFRVFADGVQVDQRSAAPGLRIQPGFAGYDVGNKVSNIQFGAYPDNVWQAAGIAPVAIGANPPLIRGNSIYNNTGVTSYETMVRSPAMVGACFVECDINPGNQYTILSLDTSATDKSPANQELHLEYISGTGSLQVFRNGTTLISTTVTVGLTGKVILSYDGFRYHIYMGGGYYAEDIAGYPSMAANPSLVHYGKWTPYNNGIGLLGLRYGPATDNSWPNQGGIGKPENFSTRGINRVFNGDGEFDASPQLNPTGWLQTESSSGTFIQCVDNNSRSGKRSIILEKPSAGAGTLFANNRAFPVTPGTTYLVRVSIVASSVTTQGLYLRIQEKTSEPSSGYVDGTNRNSVTDFVGNGPVSTSYVDYEFSYTVPAGVTWISASVGNWTNGPQKLHFDNFYMYEQIPFGAGTGGAGKPDPYATASDNMIANPNLANGTDQWAISGSASRVAGAAGDPASYLFNFPVVAGETDFFANNGTNIPLNGASVLFVSGYVKRLTGNTAGNIGCYVNFTNAVGGAVADGSYVFTPGSTGSWVAFSGTIAVPAGSASARIYFFASGSVAGAAIQLASPRVAKTQPAADVTLTAVPVVDIVQQKTIAADYLGALIGTMPVKFSPSVKRNGTSIKLDNATTYAITKLSDGSSGADGGTASVDNTNGSGTKGDVTLSAFDTGAMKISFKLTVSVSGVAIAAVDCSLTKTIGAAPGGGSKLAQVIANQGTAVTTYAKCHSAADPTLVVASGEKLYASATISYELTGGTGVRSGTFKHQYSTDDSTWTDFGAGVTGTTAKEGFYDGVGEYVDPVFGSVTINQNATVSPGTYYIRTVFVISSTGRTIWCQGETITYEAKP
jgi:hypothetical protein